MKGFKKKRYIIIILWYQTKIKKKFNIHKIIKKKNNIKCKFLVYILFKIKKFFVASHTNLINK